jgi:hypothetical protein
MYKRDLPHAQLDAFETEHTERTRFPSSGPNTQYRVLPCGSSTYAPPGKKSSG